MMRPRQTALAASWRITRAVSLQYFIQNFIRQHRTLCMSPAMTAGVTAKLWEVSDLGALARSR
jgi:hypothetical protein